MKPTLFVLAAGMGSRYGGLKQLDGLGPNGETIMDYSIYDAIRAGFGKIVFVIRHSFHEDFNRLIVSRYRDLISIVVTFQEINSIPPGCTHNNKRTKPWGTNHALLMGESVIKEPFAIINADDFYGRESFEILAEFLRSVEGKTNEYCMVGYRLGNTVTDNGSVSRGICETYESGYLTSVVECTHIEKNKDQIFSLDEKGLKRNLDANTPVSMNMWGFTPDYFEYSLESFKTFLKFHGQELKSEFYIPTVVNELVNQNKVTCKVLDTPSKWFGVTYAEDRPETVSKLNALIEQGEYPKSLFEE